MIRQRRTSPLAWLPQMFAVLLVGVPQSQAGSQAVPPGRAASDSMTLELDLARSRVEWVGTKFWGRKRHEGFVPLRGAALKSCTPAFCRGVFTLDMHNLEITDIPVSQPVPRHQLREHLRSRDFFWTEQHPVATFVLTATRAHERTDSVDALGELTLRGVTHAIRFPAHITYLRGGEVHVRAELTIDRRRWGIRYRYDPIRNELVDDDIALVIILVAHPPPS